MAEIQREDPDLVCLVEAGGASKEMERVWREGFSDLERRSMGGGIVLLVRGKIHESHRVRLGHRGRATVARVSIRGEELSVVLMDVWANPFRPRDEAFDHLEKLISPLETGPLLVLGDFNTPRASVHFDSLRSRFVHAFEAAGSGFAETWPVPVPIIDVDHVWMNGGIEVVECRLRSTDASDHRMVVVDFTPR